MRMDMPRRSLIAGVTRILVAFGAVIVSSGSVSAEPKILSAPEAQAQMVAGEIVVLDIRSPEEWAASGVAEGAWPITMHAPDFPERLQQILERHPADQVAFICATGGRTAHVINALSQHGVTGFLDLSEGMMGNPRGPGWLARGLPVVDAAAARASYEAAMSGDGS
jgi:rhodanese-related sulfurtransferase